MTDLLSTESLITFPALVFLDKNLNITKCNAEAEIILGGSGKSLLGVNIQHVDATFAQQSDVPNLQQLWQDLFAAPVQTYRHIKLASRLQETFSYTACLLQTRPAANFARNTKAATDQEGEPQEFVLILWPGTPEHFDKQITDTLFEGILLLNEELRIVSTNGAGERMTGWRNEELIGKPVQEVFPTLFSHGATQEKVKDNIGVCHTATITLLTQKDGRRITLSVRSATLEDAKGFVVGTVLCFQNCADSLYVKQVMSTVADAIFSVNTEKVITSFNRAAEKLTGWKTDEVLGRKCYDILKSSLCNGNCLVHEIADRSEELVEHSLFIKNKKKISIPVFASSTPLYDYLGNIIGSIKILRDRTTALRERIILNSIADGVFTVDKNWKITSFNQAAERITGWKQDDAIGKSCADVFHSSICGTNCAIAEALYIGEPAANRVISIHNRDGKKLPISISASPLIDHDGAIIGGVETFRDLSTINALRARLHQQYSFDAIISKSAAMQRIFAILPNVARSTSTVLITGESGTGKELIARALHSNSERSGKPFVVVNCAALPETLLESELFGYKAGAFTDAKKDKVGRFAAAEGGTLLLDEIGELPGSIQAKLLRVLQDKKYEPLGSNTPIQANVRIISATNRDLHALVQAGSFRGDLFYRLNVVNIALPPLRERKEDITLLIEHFINKFDAEQGKDIAGVDSMALSLLMRYDYPGNIRELENIIEFAFILCGSGYIYPQHLPAPFSQQTTTYASANPDTSQHGFSLVDMEKQTILQSLARNKGNKNATSRELGISRDTLRRKIAAYALGKQKEKLGTIKGSKTKNKIGKIQ